jgi:hypothetical protein
VKLRLKGWLGLVLVAALPACAGKSSTEGGAQQANAGSSQQAGAASVAGATASGGAGATAGEAPLSTTCPAERPASGSACNYNGTQCNYAVDSCNSIGFICANGVWLQQSNNDGAALTCFNFSADQLGIPKDGEGCACRGNLECTFDDCAAQGSVHAVCDNSTWHVSSEPCMDAACGPDGLRCKTGEACVARAGGIGGSYTCAADPCAAESRTLSCDCAGSLCHGPDERCVMSNGLIDCVCDTC